ncbi:MULTISPECIES: hypothetical protein [Halomonadaceae]|uniref:Uncharacterized protein n=1 Tax=Modicisalibacter zincidurans TaxID=1178777 RepID=A0ABP9RGN4_9GAMM|nr:MULTISPECIES: hypothetical protein [Halomonas]MCD6008363.1 hypothetical protein [Halomonas sp. IOP_31]
MTDVTFDSQAETSGSRQRSRRLSRWWLAGLLVGCLLPSSLVHAEAVRIAEQLTQICLMAPAAIRAESRRVARHRAQRGMPRRRHVRACLQALCTQCAGQPCAGLDVLNRRGPPARMI